MVVQWLHHLATLHPPLRLLLYGANRDVRRDDKGHARSALIPVCKGWRARPHTAR